MIRTIGMALIFGLTTMAVGQAAGDKGGKIAWQMDPEKAMKMAKASGSGMMLYFTSEG